MKRIWCMRIILLGLGAMPIFAEDLLYSLISFDKSLKELNLRVQAAIRRNIRNPQKREVWKSTINYPASVNDFLAQITINRSTGRSTKDLEKDIAVLQKQLPNKSALESMNVRSESFFLKFSDTLEKFRKLLFSYHYREDKDIVKEELFERIYRASLKFYNDFMTKRTEVLEPEKIIKSVVTELTNDLDLFSKSLDAVMKLKDWDTSGLEYLSSYLAEIQHIRSKIEHSQKKFSSTLKTNEFENLLNKVHLNELKIKNEQMRLLNLRKPEKREETLQSILESRRKYIEDDLGEDEESDWLD